MRFLVVGAGAMGGYFGGRLLEAGRDVTFLVRPARAARLAAAGITITSPAGDVHLLSPPTVLVAGIREPFDVVLLLETMLAFPEKERLLQGVSQALVTGGRFAFTLEEGVPLTDTERARMPDADTVWADLAV